MFGEFKSYVYAMIGENPQTAAELISAAYWY